MLTKDGDTILQLVTSVSFIAELVSNNFLESQYFKDMSFTDENIRNFIKSLGIDNQGMLLIFLYSLLLIPKEKIYNMYESKYDLIDKQIDSLKTSFSSTYDESNVKYIKHIRNAVGHGKVEYKEKSILFRDDFKDKKFCLELPKCVIGSILTELMRVLYEYIDDMK